MSTPVPVAVAGPKKKKNVFEKLQMSDDEIKEQIEEDVAKIWEKNISEVAKQKQILELYSRHKEKKKIRKILFDKREDNSRDPNRQHQHYGVGEDDDEEGEVHEAPNTQHQPYPGSQDEQTITIGDMSDHIRRITLTRNKIYDLLNSPRFDELIKGCFVRYHSDKTENPSNTYMIAQVVGITEGPKQYVLNNTKTKVMLKLQQTSYSSVVTLAIQLISNKHPPGSLEIQKWLGANRGKMPKQPDLKQKLQEHSKLMVEQLSSKEIDNNIVKKIRKIVKRQQQPKEDIGYLIQFMNSKLHDLDIQKEQIQDTKGKEAGREEMAGIDKEKEQYREMILKLKEILIERKTQRAREKEREEEEKRRKAKSKKEDKKNIWQHIKPKDDSINENVKVRLALLGTHEGYETVRANIIATHSAFEFPL